MDLRSIIIWSHIFIIVHVQCQNNPPSTAPGLPGYFTVYENATIGSEIFTLRAIDRDVGDTLTFRTSAADTGNLVSLSSSSFDSTSNEWTCKVLLKAELDRDNSPISRELYFNVEDQQGLTNPIRIYMIISDVNDNPPSFVGLPYRISLPEDTLIGESVKTVTATDPDSNMGASIIYMMNASLQVDVADYRDTFFLQKHSGEINLTKALDYEKRTFYHFKVYAKDEGNPPCPGPGCQCNQTKEICNPEPVDLFITVLDVQDTPPVFERLPYLGSVEEDKPVGFAILQVVAADGDRGVNVPNDVLYSLSGDDSAPFTIDGTDGTITVGKTLDADTEAAKEKGGLYVFNVTAAEVPPGQTSFPSSRNSTHSTTTQVSITVTDVNDNPPKFNGSVFGAVVLENTPSGVPLTLNSTIEVFDDDQGVNSKFKVHLEKDGAIYEDFDTIPPRGQVIQGKSSITISVANSSALDYEGTKTLSFKLIAQEITTNSAAARSSEATILLSILDTNDNNPYFPNQRTNFSVSEDVSKGYTVATVTAEDVDDGDFGKVTFKLEDDGHDGEFNISESGVVRVAAPLDREKRSSFSLVVVAADSPSAPEAQRRRSRLRIEVNITDVNDHAPEWIQVIPSVSVLESAVSGTKVTDLRAIDRDDGPNSQLQYFIAPGTNGSALFDAVEKNDLVELIVNSSLIGHDGLRLVKVTAVDMGVPPLNSTVEVSVLVIDENQHRPVFTDPDQSQFNATTGSLPEIMIKEELPIGSTLYSLKATDKDSGFNGEVEYYLDPTINKDHEFFRVDRTSGNLTSERRLDRETKEIYEIQVRAEDKGQPASLSTTMTMKVKLLDIDDNSPSYHGVDMPQVLQVIEENSTAVIGQLKPANDRDSEPYNKILCYYLYGGEELSSLSLNRTTGQMSLLQKLDRETTQQLDIVIKASPDCTLDTGAFNLSRNASDEDHKGLVQTPPSSYNESDDSLLWVRVEVLDINDNPPRFKDKDLSAGVLYDVEIGTEVISLTASVTDTDSPANSKHMFEMKPPKPVLEIGDNLDTSKAAFSISTNGSIVTNIRFSSDLLGYFICDVRVYEKNGMDDNATVKIYLISNLQRVKLVFNKLPSEVEALKHQFLKELSDIFNLDLVIDKIKGHVKPDGTRDPSKTDAYIHGRYRKTGEVVPASELWRMFDFSTAARDVLYKNGVSEALTLNKEESESDEEELKRMFAILVSVLSVLVIALILVLSHMVRMYRRRLRAATTMAYNSPTEKEMYEHPGTNKYFASENPLFGKEIKQAAVEDDRTSHNSLDVNAVDVPPSSDTPAPEEEQEVVLQISDVTEISPSHTKDVNHNAALDQVLQAYKNASFEEDDEDVNSGHAGDSHRNGHLRSTASLFKNGNYTLAIGPEVQEGVTRFSDEILSSDSGFPEGNLTPGHTHLEYTDI